MSVNRPLGLHLVNRDGEEGWGNSGMGKWWESEVVGKVVFSSCSIFLFREKVVFSTNFRDFMLWPDDDGDPKERLDVSFQLRK